MSPADYARELREDLEFYRREVDNFRNDGWVREGYLEKIRAIEGVLYAAYYSHQGLEVPSKA